MRISDWSADGCSSDLEAGREITGVPVDERRRHALPATPRRPVGERRAALAVTEGRNGEQLLLHGAHLLHHARIEVDASRLTIFLPTGRPAVQVGLPLDRGRLEAPANGCGDHLRSEEHTSELQSLIRNS